MDEEMRKVPRPVCLPQTYWEKVEGECNRLVLSRSAFITKLVREYFEHKEVTDLEFQHHIDQLKKI